jgi:[protein-PII] uridylyltransferase
MPSRAHDIDPATAFYSSMPSRYRELFDRSDAREHEEIVGRREGRPAHIELWRRVQATGAVVCVVADDRPGLLSLISAALVAHGMDVISVQAYTRHLHGRPYAEAVDFFWLKRQGSVLSLDQGPTSVLSAPILASDVQHIGEALRALVTGKLTVEELLRERRAPTSRPPNAATRVTFGEDPATKNVVLTVETFDRPGLLLAITRALFRAGVQILGSEATTREGRVIDRFTLVERDGTPLPANRRGILQMEILGAIESLSLPQ